MHPRLIHQSTNHPINFQHPSIHLVIFHPSDPQPICLSADLPFLLSIHPSIHPLPHPPSIIFHYPFTIITIHHPSIHHPSFHHPLTHLYPSIPSSFIPSIHPPTHPSSHCLPSSIYQSTIHSSIYSCLLPSSISPSIQPPPIKPFILSSKHPPLCPSTCNICPSIYSLSI